MSESKQAHPEDDVLERYVLSQSSEAELAHLEEHLLVCADCQERLDRTEDFVVAFRSAARRLELEPAEAPWWRNFFTLQWMGMPAPALAGAMAVLLLAVGLMGPWRGTPTEWQTVTLETWRGGAADPAKITTAKALDLRLDAQGLPVGAVKVEIVNENGAAQVAVNGTIESGWVSVKVPRSFEPGQYWVRLRSGGELLREYSLPVSE